MSQPRKATPQPEPQVLVASEEESEADIFVPGGWLLAMFFEMSLASRWGPVTPATPQTNEKPGGQQDEPKL